MFLAYLRFTLRHRCPFSIDCFQLNVSGTREASSSPSDDGQDEIMAIPSGSSGIDDGLEVEEKEAMFEFSWLSGNAYRHTYASNGSQTKAIVNRL